MLDKPILLCSPTRTPIGAFLGGLCSLSAAQLGAAASRGALERAKVPLEAIDEVIFGNVLQAGQGQNPARQITLLSGLPDTTPATTINKVCGSGLKAIMLAAQAIQCEDASLILAGGSESMSRAPYLLERARSGYRLGHGQLIDSVIKDGLWDVYNDLHMGACGDQCAAHRSFSRRQQDDFAVTSYQRALAAQSSGAFNDEIITVGEVAQDEQPRRFNEPKLRQLKPAFSADGSVTAGNASSLSDGAAALLVASPARAKSLSIEPQARILGYATSAREPRWFTLAPITALEKLLSQLSLAVKDIDLFEVNEAFASVPLAAMQDLGISADKLNIHGGAIALGHPIGASGARTLVTLVHALRRHKLKRGITSLCIGGGEAVAMAVELV